MHDSPSSTDRGAILGSDGPASPAIVTDEEFFRVRTLHGAPFSDDTAVLVLAPPRRGG